MKFIIKHFAGDKLLNKWFNKTTYKSVTAALVTWLKYLALTILKCLKIMTIRPLMLIYEIVKLM